MRRQRDVGIFCGRLEAGDVAAVERFEYRRVDLVVSNLVEQVNEAAVRLPEDMLQFDNHHIGSLEGETAEEVRRFVVRSQKFPVFRLDDGRQLVQVADHEQLHAAESAGVVTIAAKHVVHGIEQICPHHADLVDDDQVQRPEQLYFVAGKTPLVVDLPRPSREMQAKRQLKKRMQCHAPGVDGGDTSRCGNDHPLGAFFLDLAQERCLARAGLACEKNILACVAYVFECELELGIGNEAHIAEVCHR